MRGEEHTEEEYEIVIGGSLEGPDDGMNDLNTHGRREDENCEGNEVSGGDGMRYFGDTDEEDDDTENDDFVVIALETASQLSTDIDIEPSVKDLYMSKLVSMAKGCGYSSQCSSLFPDNNTVPHSPTMSLTWLSLGNSWLFPTSMMSL